MNVTNAMSHSYEMEVNNGNNCNIYIYHFTNIDPVPEVGKYLACTAQQYTHSCHALGAFLSIHILMYAVVTVLCSLQRERGRVGEALQVGVRVLKRPVVAPPTEG